MPDRKRKLSFPDLSSHKLPEVSDRKLSDKPRTPVENITGLSPQKTLDFEETKPFDEVKLTDGSPKDCESVEMLKTTDEPKSPTGVIPTEKPSSLTISPKPEQSEISESESDYDGSKKLPDPGTKLSFPDPSSYKFLEVSDMKLSDKPKTTVEYMTGLSPQETLDSEETKPFDAVKPIKDSPKDGEPRGVLKLTDELKSPGSVKPTKQPKSLTTSPKPEQSEISESESDDDSSKEMPDRRSLNNKKKISVGESDDDTSKEMTDPRSKLSFPDPSSHKLPEVSDRKLSDKQKTPVENTTGLSRQTTLDFEETKPFDAVKPTQDSPKDGESVKGLKSSDKPKSPASIKPTEQPSSLTISPKHEQSEISESDEESSKEMPDPKRKVSFPDPPSHKLPEVSDRKIIDKPKTHVKNITGISPQKTLDSEETKPFDAVKPIKDSPKDGEPRGVLKFTNELKSPASLKPTKQPSSLTISTKPGQSEISEGESDDDSSKEMPDRRRKLSYPDPSSYQLPEVSDRKISDKPKTPVEYSTGLSPQETLDSEETKPFDEVKTTDASLKDGESVGGLKITDKPKSPTGVKPTEQPSSLTISPKPEQSEIYESESDDDGSKKLPDPRRKLSYPDPSSHKLREVCDRKISDKTKTPVEHSTGLSPQKTLDSEKTKPIDEGNPTQGSTKVGESVEMLQTTDKPKSPASVKPTEQPSSFTIHPKPEQSEIAESESDDDSSMEMPDPRRKLSFPDPSSYQLPEVSDRKISDKPKTPIEFSTGLSPQETLDSEETKPFDEVEPTDGSPKDGDSVGGLKTTDKPKSPTGVKPTEQPSSLTISPKPEQSENSESKSDDDGSKKLPDPRRKLSFPDPSSYQLPEVSDRKLSDKPKTPVEYMTGLSPQNTLCSEETKPFDSVKPTQDSPKDGEPRRVLKTTDKPKSPAGVKPTEQLSSFTISPKPEQSEISESESDYDSSNEMLDQKRKPTEQSSSFTISPKPEQSEITGSESDDDSSNEMLDQKRKLSLPDNSSHKLPEVSDKKISDKPKTAVEYGTGLSPHETLDSEETKPFDEVEPTDGSPKDGDSVGGLKITDKPKSPIGVKPTEQLSSFTIAPKPEQSEISERESDDDGSKKLPDPRRKLSFPDPSSHKLPEVSDRKLSDKPKTPIEDTTGMSSLKTLDFDATKPLDEVKPTYGSPRDGVSVEGIKTTDKPKSPASVKPTEQPKSLTISPKPEQLEISDSESDDDSRKEMPDPRRKLSFPDPSFHKLPEVSDRKLTEKLKTPVENITGLSPQKTLDSEETKPIDEVKPSKDSPKVGEPGEVLETTHKPKSPAGVKPTEQLSSFTIAPKPEKSEISEGESDTDSSNDMLDSKRKLSLPDPSSHKLPEVSDRKLTDKQKTPVENITGLSPQTTLDSEETKPFDAVKPIKDSPKVGEPGEVFQTTDKPKSPAGVKPTEQLSSFTIAPKPEQSEISEGESDDDSSKEMTDPRSKLSFPDPSSHKLPEVSDRKLSDKQKTPVENITGLSPQTTLDSEETKPFDEVKPTKDSPKVGEPGEVLQSTDKPKSPASVKPTEQPKSLTICPKPEQLEISDSESDDDSRKEMPDPKRKLSFPDPSFHKLPEVCDRKLTETPVENITGLSPQKTLDSEETKPFDEVRLIQKSPKDGEPGEMLQTTEKPKSPGSVKPTEQPGSLTIAPKPTQSEISESKSVDDSCKEMPDPKRKLSFPDPSSHKLPEVSDGKFSDKPKTPIENVTGISPLKTLDSEETKPCDAGKPTQGSLKDGEPRVALKTTDKSIPPASVKPTKQLSSLAISPKSEQSEISESKPDDDSSKEMPDPRRKLSFLDPSSQQLPEVSDRNISDKPKTPVEYSTGLSPKKTLDSEETNPFEEVKPTQDSHKIGEPGEVLQTTDKLQSPASVNPTEQPSSLLISPNIEHSEISESESDDDIIKDMPDPKRKLPLRVSSSHKLPEVSDRKISDKPKTPVEYITGLSPLKTLDSEETKPCDAVKPTQESPKDGEPREVLKSTDKPKSPTSVKLREEPSSLTISPRPEESKFCESESPFSKPSSVKSAEVADMKHTKKPDSYIEMKAELSAQMPIEPKNRHEKPTADLKSKPFSLEQTHALDFKQPDKSTTTDRGGDSRGVAYFVNFTENDTLKSQRQSKVSLSSRMTKKTTALDRETSNTHSVRNSSLNRSKVSTNKAAGSEKPKDKRPSKTPVKDKLNQDMKTKTGRGTKSSTTQERVITDTTRISALNNQIRLERTLSPLPKQTFSESIDSNSRSATPRSRIRTDITRVPQNQTLRSFSPPPNHAKTNYSSITSVYAYNRRTQTSSTRIKKTTENIISSRSSTPNDDSQRRRLRTPVQSSAMHHYMQPTIAHSRRYESLNRAESNISLDDKSSTRSPSATHSSRVTSHIKTRSERLYYQSSRHSSSKESVQSSISKTREEKSAPEKKRLAITSKQKVTMKNSKGTDKLKHETKSTKAFSPSVIYSKDASQNTVSLERKSLFSKQKSKSIPDSNRLKEIESSTPRKMAKSAASKVPVRLSTQKSSLADDNKKKKTVTRPEQRQTPGLKPKGGGAEHTEKASGAVDVKVQKKIKNTVNQASTTKSTFNASFSRSIQVRKTAATVTATTRRDTQSANKSEKDLLNIRLTEKKSTVHAATTKVSTVRLHREPIATTLVSTVIVNDDNDSESNARSMRSNESTKSSSSSAGSRKVLTSEVFTKTCGPDKPFEVIYRQPDVDYMSIMRPQSVEQRCVYEHDVSFIDTTDSSLSDSVALPIFTSDQDRLCMASPGSPKPTRSPFALIEETLRKQQAGGFALDPTLQRQFEAVDMLTSASGSPLPTTADEPTKKETIQEYIPEPQIVSIESVTRQETGGGFLKSTEITPVPQPPSAPVTATTEPTESTPIETPSTTMTFKADAEAAPKPKPRCVKAPSPDIERAEQDEREVNKAIDDLVSVPVPKPRSQMKPSDSYRNLVALDEACPPAKALQELHQTDSVNECIEESSHTEETSVDISVRSQNIDNATTATTTGATTTSDDPQTESLDPPSELPIDGGNAVIGGGERKTSFYIGESSNNIIVKTTPTKLSVGDDDEDDNDNCIDDSEGPLPHKISELIAATDISLMKEFSVDSEEDNDVFKEYVTIKPTEEQGGTRIRRQSSETRNDLLEEDVVAKEAVEEGIKEFEEDNAKETKGSPAQNATMDSNGGMDQVDIISAGTSVSLENAKATEKNKFELEEVAVKRPTELDISLEKSEWETTEKEIPPTGKSILKYSPQQQAPIALTKEEVTQELVTKTLDEVQESLEAAKNELKSVLNDGNSIKESPSEFEFRSFSQTLSSSAASNVLERDLKTGKIVEECIELVEAHDISSFIGIPEALQPQLNPIEGLFDSSVPESLDRAAAMIHYAHHELENVKSDIDRDDRASLGFISTGTDECPEENAPKQEQASLGFVSNETVEEFSSMEDYFQETLAKADTMRNKVEADKETAAQEIVSFPEISSECTIKPFDDVIHRVKPNTSDVATNRWSVPEVDQSSSSESYYKSLEKSESRPLSTDVDNLTTQGTSEYKTAAEGSSTYRETTEYMSAASTLDSLSGKTISSHDSMRSFDSHSETSANLISMDSSELTETLVASSTDDVDDHLRDLLDEDDSEESLDLEAADYAVTESKTNQQSMMKRSQEMIFKPKSEDTMTGVSNNEERSKEGRIESIQIEEYAKPKEAERTWGLTYPMEDAKSEDIKETDDILLYHGDVRRSIDESKYASSLDDGSVLSVSMSSASNIDTVVENFEDIAGSFGASSLAGIEGFGASSLPEETTFVLDMDGSRDQSPQETSSMSPADELNLKRGHKRTESTDVSTNEEKKLPEKEGVAVVGEGKESGSESDTDPYETEYARQFRSPTDRKSKKKKQAAAEMDHSFETEKRPFTPSQLVAEVIVEDVATEELEAEAAMVEDRRPSQNMLDYSNIPDITVTEDVQQKSPILEEETDTFEEKILYKVKTQEELHKVTDDKPIYQEPKSDAKEDSFQKLVQEQYKQKLAELKQAEIGDSDYDEHKAPDSPDSFEMVDQPDISDDFVIIEEVAKEANEDDLGGKSIRIQPTKYESKHDEEVEKMIIKSAPADPMLGSQIFRDDLNFEFEESPPTASSGGTGSETHEESDSGSDLAATNKRWVEMQLTDNQLRYPYELTGGVLEDIKEEDGEFEVGSSRISSFKDSFSSTPEYDAMAARRYYNRGEHDDVSMSSLQEFESLEQAISLENRNRTHQGSTDSSNGSFQRRYLVRHSGSGAGPGDDISVSSLKEFEGLENACIEAHLIEIKAKEEAALLSRSDESNKSNGSDREPSADSSNVVVSKVTRTVTHTEVLTGSQSPDIETLLKQKLQECERVQTASRIPHVLDAQFKTDSDKGSIDSLEMNKSLDLASSSADESFDISKDATKSDIDSLEVDKPHTTREDSFESTDMQQMDDLISKFGVTIGDGLTTTTTTTTTSTDADGQEHTTVTKRVVTTTTLTASGPSSTSLDLQLPQALPKDISADSLNQISIMDHTTTSSAGTTATYQTSAGNSQMSGSVTSCASSTLMEDSTTSITTSGLTTIHYSPEQHISVHKEADAITPKTDELKR
uniref:Uncharacterized protein n=1 Tax=Stomoxys calcitrans TaxID=35570 RepID=A0A1I8Q3J3_STOCA